MDGAPEQADPAGHVTAPALTAGEPRRRPGTDLGAPTPLQTQREHDHADRPAAMPRYRPMPQP